MFFAKLPNWFKVPTPLGSYNPDWAVNAIGPDGKERLYLVIETKSSLFEGNLREKELKKIECGKEHFGALARAQSGNQLSLVMEGKPVQYLSATEWADVEAEMEKG